MQEELLGTRDRSYSAWHRRHSTRRFIGIEDAQLLAMIDLDASLYVEYDNGDKEPLALIETAIDKGQTHKSSTVTQKLAIRSGLPAYVVLYRLSAIPNPADENWKDIASFRVRRINPQPEQAWRIYTPQQWAENLLKLRRWRAEKIDFDFFQSSCSAGN